MPRPDQSCDSAEAQTKTACDLPKNSPLRMTPKNDLFILKHCKPFVAAVVPVCLSHQMSITSQKKFGFTTQQNGLQVPDETIPIC